MNRTLVGRTSILAIAIFAGSAAAQTKPAFAELTWYSSKAAVKKQLAARGYKFSSQSGPDLEFTGSILGNAVEVTTIFNNKDQLVKVMIIFTKSSQFTSLYNTLKKSAVDKYGPGEEVNTVGTYASYDSLMKSEILKNQKVLGIYWTFPNNYYLALLVENPYTNADEIRNVMHYESPAWKLELERRKNSGDI